MFSPLPGTGFLQNNCFFGGQKVFCQTFFTSMATRFMNITDDDVEIFIEGEENENTRKKTRQDISLIVSFIASEKQTNESFEIEQLSPEELDGHLSKFLLAVRKKNGDEFEPTTLRGFLSSVERYLKKVDTVNQF